MHVQYHGLVKVFLIIQWEPSFSNIDTSWKNKIDWNTWNGDKSFKNFSSNSIIFHRLKWKPNDFLVLGGTGSKERKLLHFKSRTKNFTEDTKAILNYIYLLQDSVICFDSSIWYQLIATKRNPWVPLHFQSTN